MVGLGCGEVGDLSAEGYGAEGYVVLAEDALLCVGPGALAGQGDVMLDVVVVGILPVLVGADALGEGEGGAVALSRKGQMLRQD